MADNNSTPTQLNEKPVSMLCQRDGNSFTLPDGRKFESTWDKKDFEENGFR